MEEFDDYFTELSRATDLKYRRSISSLYRDLRTGNPPDVPDVQRISDLARQENRQKSLAFLARECNLNLTEVSDRFMTINAERSAFLGFRMEQDDSEPRMPYIPSLQDLGPEGRARYTASKKAHPEAGAATVFESAPSFLDLHDRNFLPKKTIWLNKEEQEMLATLNLIRLNTQASVLRCIAKAENKMTSLQTRLFRRGKIAVIEKGVESIRGLTRVVINVLCEWEQMLYADAMGKDHDDERDRELCAAYQHFQLVLANLISDMNE